MNLFKEVGWVVADSKFTLRSNAITMGKNSLSETWWDNNFQKTSVAMDKRKGPYA